MCTHAIVHNNTHKCLHVAPNRCGHVWFSVSRVTLDIIFTINPSFQINKNVCTTLKRRSSVSRFWYAWTKTCAHDAFNKKICLKILKTSLWSWLYLLIFLYDYMIITSSLWSQPASAAQTDKGRVEELERSNQSAGAGEGCPIGGVEELIDWHTCGHLISFKMPPLWLDTCCLTQLD